MSKVSKRVLHYLLSRQRRAARLEGLGRAAEADILESRLLGETARSGTVWQLPPDQAALFSGDLYRDRELVRTALEASARNRKSVWLPNDDDEFGDPGDDVEFTEDSDPGQPGQPRDAVDGGGEYPADVAHDDGQSPAETKAPAISVPGGNPLQPDDLAARRDYVLSIVQSLAPPLKPAEVATALLLARAVGRDDRTFDHLLSSMESLNPIVAIHVPVHDFVRQFGLMVEDGLILPFCTSLSSIVHGPTLSGRHKPLADSRRRKSLECLKGSIARRYDEEELRQIVSKHVLGLSKPLVIADSKDEPLPPRLKAVADVVIEGDGIDASLIADVLMLCCKISIERSWFLLNELDFEPQHLGIDDLAVAIRPGRTLTRIIGALVTLETENAAKSDEDGDDKKRGRLNSSRSSASSAVAANRKKYAGCFDVIEPVGIVAGSKPGNGPMAKQTTKPAKGKDELFVEQLAGYGAARQWALDLKLDLQSFRKDEVEWSDLSSRLLLSGPPGTGKTTFARALCNTLQVPLIATSVARWLEPSHLGDVLAAIGATFDHVSQNAPCILFIDEIDNIGTREGSSDRNGDYWASLINRLLELLDGAAKTSGVIIVGATNRPEKIDSALLRSGRLETHIVIPAPDTEALIGIIAHHLGADLDAVLTSSDSVSNSNASEGTASPADLMAARASRPGTSSSADRDRAPFKDNQKGRIAHG